MVPDGFEPQLLPQPLLAKPIEPSADRIRRADAIAGGCHDEKVVMVRRKRKMPINFAAMTPRNFDLMSAPGLSKEARNAVDAAFVAMSNWRTEIVNSSDKNIEQVIEKMAEAARALGWPEQIVDATRAQMQSITKMQIQAMDSMMDAWEGQIKSPNPASMLLSKLKSEARLAPAGSWPTAGDMASMNPLQLFMPFAEQWQKACTDAMAFWAKGRQPGS